LKFKNIINNEIKINFVNKFIELLLVFNSLKAILEIYKKIIIRPPM